MQRIKRRRPSSQFVSLAMTGRAFSEPLEARRLLSAASPMFSPSVLDHLSTGSAMVAQPLTTAIPASAVPAGSASPVGYTPAQIKSAYGISSIKFGSIVGDGSGQTIAVINAYDNPKLVDSTDPNFVNSDLHKFDVQFGLPDPPSFIKVDQNGGKNYPATDASWANEAALDVEWVHAIAPKANILLVEANSGGLNDLISSAVEYARLQPGVSVITMSFAASEAAGETFYDSYFLTPSGHGGVTYVAASGDNGSTGGYPAFSPNVVAVGSTTLTLSGSSYVGETGRSNSGGGISQFESKPAYQTDVTQSNSLRTIPDVAFDGDPNTGVAVYDSFNGGSQPWYKVGGTSLSAPAWAGLIAITNQGRALKGLGTLDGSTQTLPRLYELSSNDFHDITGGNNGFAAGAGYDLVTGRGTPKANTLVPDLAGGGSISGTIFDDINGNGVPDSGEPGLQYWGCFIDFNGNGSFDRNDIRVYANASGSYTFNDLPGGVTYRITQGTVSGWRRTTPSSFPMTVTLAAGQVVTGKNIGQQRLNSGSISGRMFNDTNGDGIQESGEAPLVGWGCFIDFNNDDVFDGSDVRVFADANGNYSFNNLAPGTYHIVQNTPAGWQRIVPSTMPYVVTLTSSNPSATGINFANRPVADMSISGTMFDDINGNGVRDAGEPPLTGWGCFIDFNNDGVFDGNDIRKFADANGNYSFNDLAPGTYHIVQNTPAGWQRIVPSTMPYVITLTSGGPSATGINFANRRATATITGTIFNDLNGNGVRDAGEPGLIGWGVFIDNNNNGVFDPGTDVRVFSDSSGNYALAGLPPGTYRVNEGIPTGWRRTTSLAGYLLTLTAGQVASGINIGSQLI